MCRPRPTCEWTLSQTPPGESANHGTTSTAAAIANDGQRLQGHAAAVLAPEPDDGDRHEQHRIQLRRRGDAEQRQREAASAGDERGDGTQR